MGAAAGNVTDAFSLQGLDETRFVTIPKKKKKGQFALITGRVHAKQAYFGNTRGIVEWEGAELLNEHSAEVSQLAVVSLPPGEDLPVHGQGHGVATAGVHGHFFHHIVAESSDLAGDGDGPTRQAQAQPAVGGLSASVDLSLHRHCTINAQVRPILQLASFHCNNKPFGILFASQEHLKPTCKEALGATSLLDHIESRQSFREGRHFDL